MCDSVCMRAKELCLHLCISDAKQFLFGVGAGNTSHSKSRALVKAFFSITMVNKHGLSSFINAVYTAWERFFGHCGIGGLDLQNPYLICVRRGSILLTIMNLKRISLLNGFDAMHFT